MTRTQPEKGHKPEPQTVISVDKQQYKVSGTRLTVTEILRLRFGPTADVSLKLLTLRHGNDITKFEDPNAAVPLENGMHFVVLDQSPTTVS